MSEISESLVWLYQSLNLACTQAMILTRAYLTQVFINLPFSHSCGVFEPWEIWDVFSALILDLITSSLHMSILLYSYIRVDLKSYCLIITM